MLPRNAVNVDTTALPGNRSMKRKIYALHSNRPKVRTLVHRITLRHQKLKKLRSLVGRVCYGGQRNTTPGLDTDHQASYTLSIYCGHWFLLNLLRRNAGIDLESITALPIRNIAHYFYYSKRIIYDKRREK